MRTVTQAGPNVWDVVEVADLGAGYRYRVWRNAADVTNLGAPATDRAATAVEAAQALAVDTGDTRAANAATVADLADQALATLQGIIDTPDAAFNTLAGGQAAVRALQAQVRTEARILRRLIRLVVGDLTGTD